MKNFLLLLFLTGFTQVFSQPDSMFKLEYNFNEHEIKEVNDRLPVKGVDALLGDDRFGNEESAVYLAGQSGSYLNLGTSELLKAKETSISIWVNLTRRIYTGKGYENNPILIIKNRPQDDFYVAYAMGYDAYCERYCAGSTKDSIIEVGVSAKKLAEFGKWFHFVLTSDNNYLAFYINGELQGRKRKDFETVFLSTDSMVIGHSANKKNFRFSQGYFDDIQIFHRVLNDKEVKELYEAPNPNRYKVILNTVLKIAGLLLAVSIVAFLLVANRRRSLKKEREKFELKSKMSEMEIRVIKAQINPHFMSNCLSAIQNLIIRGKVYEANEYIAKFGFIVRQVLNFSTRSLITLQEELEIIKLNVDLERLRFENVFVFDLSVEEAISTDTIFIPPLIFQPIIENAIWHGLLPLPDQKDARLKMTVKKEKDLLVIVIEDNGVGRKPGSNKIGNSKESKGIKITLQRIENINNLHDIKTSGIIYQDLFDNDSRPAGTRVTITLPSDLIPGDDD